MKVTSRTGSVAFSYAIGFADAGERVAFTLQGVEQPHTRAASTSAATAGAPLVQCQTAVAQLR